MRAECLFVSLFMNQHNLYANLSVLHSLKHPGSKIPTRFTTSFFCMFSVYVKILMPFFLCLLLFLLLHLVEYSGCLILLGVLYTYLVVRTTEVAITFTTANSCHKPNTHSCHKPLSLFVLYSLDFFNSIV